MYNHTLNTFIAVADYGSFTKASNKLYISPTAVMKQINALENSLNLQLFERSSSGVLLTSAGNEIYRAAKFIISYSDKAVEAARAKTYADNTTFCVGTSLLNPAKPFMDIWYKVNNYFPNYKLHLVPFDDNHEGIVSTIENLGIEFDFLFGVCDSKIWLSKCNFLPLGKYKKMVAVAAEHPLAKKEKISIEDLYGQTLMMVKRGDSYANDRIRDDLEENYPMIKIEDTPHFYDLSVFNRCAESQKILLTIECWQDVHPGLVTIDVNWDYKIPYGLLYSYNAPKDVIKFIEIVNKEENG